MPPLVGMCVARVHDNYFVGALEPVRVAIFVDFASRVPRLYSLSLSPPSRVFEKVLFGTLQETLGV